MEAEAILAVLKIVSTGLELLGNVKADGRLKQLIEDARASGNPIDTGEIEAALASGQSTLDNLQKQIDAAKQP